MGTITVPGVHDLTDAEYFAHPALSHSDLKLLARCPARYRWVKDNRVVEHRSEFDFGHAVHELVLGAGAGIDIIDADNWRTKAAQEARAESHAAGRAPMLRADYETAETCASAVFNHPVAAKLLNHKDHAEVTCIWEADDVERRAKIDAVSGRFIVDLKTGQSADTDTFGRSAAKFGYATQDAWYRDAARACLDIPEPKFLFVVVEKDPPHLVNVIELDPYDVELGARANKQTVALYRHCRDTDTWPAYGDGINQASLPRWAEIEMEGE